MPGRSYQGYKIETCLIISYTVTGQISPPISQPYLLLVNYNIPLKVSTLLKILAVLVIITPIRLGHTKYQRSNIFCVVIVTTIQLNMHAGWSFLNENSLIVNSMTC